MIAVTATEERDDGGAAEERTWRTFYDNLDRPVASLDPAGNARRTIYDARGNAVGRSDANAAVGAAASALDLFDLGVRRRPREADRAAARRGESQPC